MGYLGVNMNPLLQFNEDNHNAIPFDKIKAEHFLPALDESIKTSLDKLEEYKKGTDTSFDSNILALEELSEQVDYIATVFYAIYGAHATDDIQKISEEVSQKLTKYGNDITLDSGVFARVKACYEAKQDLTNEQKQVLDSYYKDFTRNGALLNDEDKNKLREISEKLSGLSLKFSKNVLDATNEYELLVTDEADVEGIPKNVLEGAKELAQKKGKEGWMFTLQYPSYGPFITYCPNEKLREEMARANGTKTYKSKYDNQDNIKETLKLKQEKAKLLGFKNHADFVLQRRMASTSEQVTTFLNDLLIKALPVAKDEIKRIEAMKGSKLNPWDSSFYAEKLKKQELDLDEEMLRPYFKLENVIDGMFQVANKLFGLNFKERTDIPKYHEEIKTYEVTDSNGEHVSLFFADFFPRETKRGGAWMTNLFDQGYFAGKVRRPHVSIVCNFTKPTKTTPSLITFNEVTTLFHEFGHALHGMLSKCTYRKLSGTSVYWDFVELPSQIMENWVMEKECLDLFATHYETGEKIPADLVEKIKKSGKFLQGLATIRQISFGLVDMAFHTTDATKINDIVSFEHEHMKKATVMDPIDGTCFSTAFSHIFAGGYSAGYYSYKWAEVLDADAFEFFQEKGIFDKEVATKFKENVLERGGTEHPMELYKKFRGKEPNVDALLRRAGLL
jgi:Zn-dependent oligopeptidase